MNVRCYHCQKPAGSLSLDNIRKMYKGILVDGFAKLFCNEKCYRRYLKRYLVEEYKGNEIYWVIMGRRKLYLPYPGAPYAFKTLQAYRDRMDQSSIGVLWEVL